MPERKLGKLKFLKIRTADEEDAMYALGALHASHIDSVIGEEYRFNVGRQGYIESVIALNEEFEEEATDILRHLSMVERLWKQKVSYEAIIELETYYTKSLGEEFGPEQRMS